MKIQINKVVRPFDLGEYAKELAGQTVDVWVNPTRNILGKLDDLELRSSAELGKVRNALPKEGEDRTNYQKALEHLEKWTKDEYAPRQREWYAALWSHGDDKERHWTADELKDLDDTDPALYQFMRTRTLEMIREHREREKKD